MVFLAPYWPPTSSPFMNHHQLQRNHDIPPVAGSLFNKVVSGSKKPSVFQGKMQLHSTTQLLNHVDPSDLKESDLDL